MTLRYGQNWHLFLSLRTLLLTAKFIRQTHRAIEVSHFQPSRELLLSSEVSVLSFRFYGLVFFFIFKKRITCSILKSSLLTICIKSPGSFYILFIYPGSH